MDASPFQTALELAEDMSTTGNNRLEVCDLEIVNSQELPEDSIPKAEPGGSPVEEGKEPARPKAQPGPTIQDLCLEIEVLREVNAHLNSQVEKSTYEIDVLSDDVRAWKARAKILTQALNRLKKQQTVEGPESLAAIVSSVLSSGDTGESNDEDIIESLCQAMGEEDSSCAADIEGIDLKSLIERGRTGGWLLQSKEVQMGTVIGEGAFGTTYMGVWRGASVAVKTITIRGKEDLISFLREVEALAGLRHPNVMPFLGVCLEVPTKFWLICEYLPGGTLSKQLHGNIPRLNIVQKLEYALEIAQGMQACHQCNPPIIHRDIKPSNVFIDGSGHAKVGDFGLARRLQPDSKATMTSETGTYLYMSPEMIRHDTYDLTTDVWSWGVLTCEIITQSLPYHGQFLTPIQVAVSVSHGKLKPRFPQGIHPALTKLLELCFLLDASQRPSFKMVVIQLSSIIRDIRENIQSDPQADNFLQRLFFKEGQAVTNRLMLAMLVCWGSM